MRGRDPPGSRPRFIFLCKGTAPGAVRNLLITPGDASIQVSWHAPDSNGGLAITGYQVTASDGVHTPIAVTVMGTSGVLSGLTNGTSYTVSTVCAPSTRGSVGDRGTVVRPAV